MPDAAVMKYHGLPILASGFALLILLTAITGFISTQRTAAAARELARIQQDEMAFAIQWNELQNSVSTEAVLARDLLIEGTSDDALRRQFEAARTDINRKLDQLASNEATDGGALSPLRDSLNDYHNVLESILRPDPRLRSPEESKLLLRQAAATRQTVFAVADRIRELVEADSRATQRRILESDADTEVYLRRLWSVTVLLSLIVAGGALLSISRLGRRIEAHRGQLEGSREELRSLSQSLVRAQEDERKLLSRELHDQVGQMLTAIRMEIRAMLDLRHAPTAEFAERANEALALSDQTLQIVRDMAMGLRPSMLDDLGLGAAIEWLTRDLSRRSGVATSTEIDAQLGALPDSHGTCLFRIAQESLTNVLRHANANRVHVTLLRRDGRLLLTVQDDGSGIDLRTLHRGIGLLGMEERARELHGKLTIDSDPARGTLLRVEIPVETPADKRNPNVEERLSGLRRGASTR
jgi:signal transduction histidine kinase